MKNLGENGTFRIRRNNDECGFESIIIGGLARRLNCLIGLFIGTVTDIPDIKSTTIKMASTSKSRPITKAVSTTTVAPSKFNAFYRIHMVFVLSLFVP